MIKRYDDINPVRIEEAGDYLYALWRNRGLVLSGHTHFIDVVHYKKRGFLFWKKKRSEIIAVFKIKKRLLR